MNNDIKTAVNVQNIKSVKFKMSVDVLPTSSKRATPLINKNENEIINQFELQNNEQVMSHRKLSS